MIHDGTTVNFAVLIVPVADMKMTLADCYNKGKCQIWKGCDILGDSQ